MRSTKNLKKSLLKGTVGSALLSFVPLKFAIADSGPLSQVKDLIGNGAIFLGGVLVVIGLIQFGMGWKDGTGGGGQLNGAIGFMVGGGIIVAAAAILKALQIGF